MSTRQTRKQAAASSNGIQSPKPAEEEDHSLMNGNGSAHTGPAKGVAKENIFLFWPNVIGTHSLTLVSIFALVC